MRGLLAILFWCKLMKWHDWTCAAEQGIKPTEKQLKSGIAGFEDYATSWCSRCDEILRPLP